VRRRIGTTGGCLRSDVRSVTGGAGAVVVMTTTPETRDRRRVETTFYFVFLAGASFGVPSSQTGLVSIRIPLGVPYWRRL
jgi:hypothetical protein